MKEKIDEILNINLAECNVPFTYDRAKMVRNTYYDDKNYEIHIMFENYNKTFTDHRNVLNCYDGQLSQIMFQDNGFPGASICFDRELLPEVAVKTIVEIASMNPVKEDNKKANI